jgi:competence ComEA-like helix-hairpin-helix protein
MMRLPYFSRAQLGVILLLGAALMGLYAWRAHWLWPPASPAPGLMPLAFVEVSGQAAHPGVYSFPQPPTLAQVWQKAGAPGTPPDPEKKLSDGIRVEVTAPGAYRLTAMSGPQMVTLGLPLDVNWARAADLEAVPGLGPALAQKIVAYRQAHGPFTKIDDLTQVAGLSAGKLVTLKPYLDLGGRKIAAPHDWQAAMGRGPSAGTKLTPPALLPQAPGRLLDPNRASQKELEALPGIGPKKLARLRPYLTIQESAQRD